MQFDLDKIFIPSTGVDLVFNIDSTAPLARASIIYDTDHKNKTITIAQPRIPVNKSTEFRQLHLTTIVQTKKRKTRIGINCRPVRFIDKYPLANKTYTRALVLGYSLPLAEANIRSAFRLPLSSRHTVKAKLHYDNRDYFTVKDFRIKDVSFNGLGLVLAKQSDTSNPLTGIGTGTILPMGISLVDTGQEIVLATFPIKVRVVRIDPNYSNTHTLIGLSIQVIAPENEDLLIKFIHDAQIEELKRLSQKG